MARQSRLNPSPRPRWSFDNGDNGRGRTRPVIRSRTTAEDVLRREALASAGVADRGQSLTDAAQLARGTRATPLSRDMATLQAGNRPAAWFPDSTTRTAGPGIVTPSMRTASAAAAIRSGGAGADAPFRGSTPDEVSKFMADGENPVGDVALTGKTKQTAYGTVSSRTPSWQEQLVGKYPEIGQAGTQANDSFVTAFKAAGDSADPNAIAAQVYSNIKSPKETPTLGGDASALAEKPLALGAGLPSTPSLAGNRPVSLAGGSPDAPDWLVPQPATPGATAGANLRSRASDIMAESDSPLSLAKKAVSVGGSAMGAAKGAMASIGDFGKALFGDTSPKPSATQPLAQTTAATAPNPLRDSSSNFPLTAPKPGALTLGQADQNWLQKPPSFTPPGTKPDPDEEKRKRQLAGTSY